jgi:hypothetical protein
MTEHTYWPPSDWTPERIAAHEAHQARMDAEEPFEVRIDGGIDALRDALRASDREHRISTRNPLHGPALPPVTAQKLSLRERAELPVRFTADRRIFIGDQEFPYPVAEGSAKVRRGNRNMNGLTLTLFVGEVTVEPGSKAFPSHVDPPPPLTGARVLDDLTVPPEGQRAQVCLIHQDKHDARIGSALDFYSIEDAREWLTGQLDWLDRHEAAQRELRGE